LKFLCYKANLSSSGDLEHVLSYMKLTEGILYWKRDVYRVTNILEIIQGVPDKSINFTYEVFQEQHEARKAKGEGEEEESRVAT
jgi:hypothetical protein